MFDVLYYNFRLNNQNIHFDQQKHQFNLESIYNTEYTRTPKIYKLYLENYFK
jgi:hypothetical protein